MPPTCPRLLHVSPSSEFSIVSESVSVCVRVRACEKERKREISSTHRRTLSLRTTLCLSLIRPANHFAPILPMCTACSHDGDVVYLFFALLPRSSERARYEVRHAPQPTLTRCSKTEYPGTSRPLSFESHLSLGGSESGVSRGEMSSRARKCGRRVVFR